MAIKVLVCCVWSLLEENECVAETWLFCWCTAVKLSSIQRWNASVVAKSAELGQIFGLMSELVKGMHLTHAIYEMSCSLVPLVCRHKKPQDTDLRTENKCFGMIYM